VTRGFEYVGMWHW